uniref:WAP domain-containing protein n=1 Tax=Anolis carolinensis TaxID=28377 RepID=A0A803SLR6_ANOCA
LNLLKQTIHNVKIIICKPGFCPIDNCRCAGPKPNECKNDYTCTGHKKCCMFCCAMRCKDPVKGIVEIEVVKEIIL